MTEPGISNLMQSLGRYSVPYVNVPSQRTGTLWEGRYRAMLLDAERSLRTCYQYIALNPVRAGMVAPPVVYPWSHSRQKALGEPEALVSPHALYEALGAGRAVRQHA